MPNSKSQSFFVVSTVNMAAVGVSVWQAIKARHMTSEFSESKYIGLTVFSMAQGFVTGIPVAAVVKDIPKGACVGCPNSSVAMLCVTFIVNPILIVYDAHLAYYTAFYLVLTFLLFVLCMVILMLIFLPKIAMQRKYAGLSKGEQKKLMSLAISVGQKGSSQDFRAGSGYNRGSDSQWTSKPFAIPAKPNPKESSQYVSELTSAHIAEAKMSYEFKEAHVEPKKSTASYCVSSDNKTVESIMEEEQGATELFRQLLKLSRDEEGDGDIRSFFKLVDPSELTPFERDALEATTRLLEVIEESPR